MKRLEEPEQTQPDVALGQVLRRLQRSRTQTPTEPVRSVTTEPVGARSNPRWDEIVRLRREASDALTRRFEQWHDTHGTALSSSDRTMLGQTVVAEVVSARAAELARAGQALWTEADEAAHRQALFDSIFGYGRLQPLFDIDEAENIEIHGWDSVVVQYDDGRRAQHPAVADSDEELVEAVRFLGQSVDPPRPFDDAHPMMTIALGDQFRLHAIGFGLSHRPSVVIRHHRHTAVTLAQLAEQSMMPMEVADLLRAAVLARKSIVVSGDQGAGKTTLLRALVDAIAPEERFGTIETDYELLTHLLPQRRNILALQSRVGLGERVDGERLGEWTVAQLIPEALRQNLTRLVVGEVRGEEAGALFQAMQSGAGSMSTTHSHSASATIDRLASRVAAGGVIGLDEAYRQVAHNLHLLVHLQLVDDTWRGGRRRRFVSEVRWLTGAIENGRPTTHVVYAAPTSRSSMVYHPDPELSAELAEFGFVGGAS